MSAYVYGRCSKSVKYLEKRIIENKEKGRKQIVIFDMLKEKTKIKSKINNSMGEYR